MHRDSVWTEGRCLRKMDSKTWTWQKERDVPVCVREAAARRTDLQTREYGRPLSSGLWPCGNWPFQDTNRVVASAADRCGRRAWHVHILSQSMPVARPRRLLTVYLVAGNDLLLNSAPAWRSLAGVL